MAADAAFQDMSENQGPAPRLTGLRITLIVVCRIVDTAPGERRTEDTAAGCCRRVPVRSRRDQDCSLGHQSGSRGREFVVILGETGCGKSTLLRLILGQESPTAGSVVVDGKSVTRIDARCGYVPQKYSLFPDRTVLGNVLYGPENSNGHFIDRMRPSFYRRRRDAEPKRAPSFSVWVSTTSNT